jgi:hypothetical protein
MPGGLYQLYGFTGNYIIELRYSSFDTDVIEPQTPLSC